MTKHEQRLRHALALINDPEIYIPRLDIEESDICWAIAEIDSLRATPISELLPEDKRGAHVYTSTACHHGLHARCRQTCKFCGRACVCECHAKEASE